MQVSVSGLLMTRRWAAQLPEANQRGECQVGGERGRGRAASHCNGEQMLWWRWKEDKGEVLTSEGVREGGGVSERTLIRLLGHIR